MAKPNLPDTIRVCGKDYSVECLERNSLGADRSGEANHHALRITYDTTWAPAQQRDTMLHEVLHCCEAAAGMDLDERTIASLATLLYGVLADNPEFARWLIAER